MSKTKALVSKAYNLVEEKMICKQINGSILGVNIVLKRRIEFLSSKM